MRKVRKTLLVRPALLLLAVICAAAAMGKADGATRLALVGGEGNVGVESVLDMAMALLGKEADLQLLDRAEVGRVLREHELSLAGLVGAEHAVKTGQLLQADLFAVLEGTLTNETAGATSLGLVVFDAKSGARYADSALVSSNIVSAASAAAAAVRAAVLKSHQGVKDLHTLGLLTVRNADLPRQFDGLCDTVGLLLERELTASPGIAVLERRRLEQVTQERSVAPDAEGNRLLSSLRMIELDISQDGVGLRAVLGLVGADGARTNAVTASVPTRDAAALAQVLADQTERFLKVPSDGITANRGAEAARFHRESLLLIQHRDLVAAVHPLDAAIALAPEQTSWQWEMAHLLPYAAIEVFYPGGAYRWSLPVPQPTSASLAACLAMGQRGADLLLDLSREATKGAKPGEPLPETLNSTYRYRLCELLQRLAYVKTADPASAAAIACLAGKERTLRMEIMEPFLAKQAVDRATFAAYGRALQFWFNMEGNNRPGLDSEQRRQDDALALSHWVEVSHKLNPPDGSGDYSPMVTYYRKPNGFPSDQMLAAEREFRLYAQDLLARGDAAKPGPYRGHVWQAITSTLGLLVNHDQCGTEYLEACRFAFAQGDIQPDLFYHAAEALDFPRSRNLPGELEVVNGALKLILEKPEAYPKQVSSNRNNRSDVIKDLEQTRDRVAGQLAGAGASAPAPAPWKQEICLLDLATPINGFSWLFKPVVQDGQVFALALGLHDTGLPEDSLQLVRVPLRGGSPSFLGKARFTGIQQGNRPAGIPRGSQYMAPHETPGRVEVGRAACVGAGCYFAATCSGVFIFPTNGGPVLHLGTSNGLPSDDTHALAFLDGKLYLGAGETERDGYLASYVPATREVAILASSRRSVRLSPFDDGPPFYTLGLAPDPARHRLLLAVSTAVLPNGRVPDITPGMGIWSYLPSTGEYMRLAPLRLLPMPAVYIQTYAWTGLADANTLAVKDLYTMALYDLRNDRLLSACDIATPITKASSALWPRPVPGSPGSFTLATGPFLLRDGWFYSARPFDRMALADGRREQFLPPRTDYPFEPKESLQLLDDGIHVLAADQFSLWLLELKPEAAPAPVEDDKSNPAAGKP